MSDDFEEDGRGNPRQNSTWLQIRVSTALDPRNMTSLDADTDAIVEIMHSRKRISGKQGDRVKEKSEQFLQNNGCKQE